MLEPRRIHRRKVHRGRFQAKAHRGHTLAFGEYGIKAMEAEFITARQIEACRIAITRRMQRQGQVWIRVFPDRPLTKKPAEVRMGSGKGTIEKWAASVEPGRILFEIGGVSDIIAREALRLAQFKLPIKTKIIVRRDHNAI